MSQDTKRKCEASGGVQNVKSLLDNVDTYVDNAEQDSFPFRHLPEVLGLSCATEETWISEGRKLVVDREPLVKATMRQVFDRYFCTKKPYTHEMEMSNSFKRAVDFDMGMVKVTTVIRLIQARGGFFLVSFKFVYNPLFVGKILEMIRKPTYGRHTGVQTIVMVTNSYDDVENVIKGKRESMRHVLTGTDTTTLLDSIDYDALGRKYIIVCDALVVFEQLRRQDNSHILAICPYYVITTESRALREMQDIALDPLRRIHIVEGLLYPEFASPNGDILTPTMLTDLYINVQVSATKNIELHGKMISLMGMGSKVILNNDDEHVYTIEEFLIITNKGVSHTVTALSTIDDKKTAQIKTHNEKNVDKLSSVLLQKMQMNFMYISGNNKITIIFEKGDFVYVTEQSGSIWAGKRGSLRDILHPVLGSKYDYKTHFHQLVYLMELENAQDTVLVVSNNVEKNQTRLPTDLTPLYPVKYLQLAISDLCHCRRPVV
jgi:hypothetical protein